MVILRRLAAIVAVTALASCATSGLQRAGQLGNAGSQLMTRAEASYGLASDQLEQWGTYRCTSLILAGSDGCTPEMSEGVANLNEIIEARQAFYASLNTYYVSFGDTARLAPVSLTEATNTSVDLAKNIALLMRTKFSAQGETALRSAGARVEALVQLLEENNRLNQLRKSSALMREALPIIVASYDLERDVLASIDTVNAAQRRSAVDALSGNRILDAGPLIARAPAVLGLPVAPLNAQTNAAWQTPRGQALVLFVAAEEDRRLLAQRQQANTQVAIGLRALMRAHLDFEQNREVTVEDIQVASTRLSILLGRSQ